MKTPEDIEQLEHLLRHRDFVELTEEEKKWVLQRIQSEETYAAMRLVETQLQQAFSQEPDLQPRAGLSDTARERLRANAAARPQGGFTRLLKSRVPVYQVAAGALLLLGWAFWQKNGENAVPVSVATPAKDTVVVVRRDTVVRQQNVYVVRYRNVYLPQPPAAADTTASSRTKPVKMPSAQGVTMGEDTLLLRFFVNETEH
jgi:hypothetical protein